MNIVVDDPKTSAEGDNTQQRAAPAAKQDNIPEKYRGKSLDEVIRMHQESESALGRKNDEIGQWRSLTEALATRTPQDTPNDKPADPLSDDDFFKSPAQATKRAIEEAISARLTSIEQNVRATRVESDFDRFQREYPDYEQTARSDNFRAWVGKSQRRMNSAAAAAKGDLDSARGLLEDWKEIEAITGQSKELDASGRPERTEDPGVAAARAASTDTGARRAAPAGKATYTRAELVDMIVHNPGKYESLQAEITQAIREGRVSGF